MNVDSSLQSSEEFSCKEKRMDYYRIADNNISVLWENEAGKAEFYGKLGISFHPVFLGAYELSDKEREEVGEYDMQICMRNNGEFETPLRYTTVSHQIYYKQGKDFCITFVRKGSLDIPIMTIKTSDSFRKVEMIPHSDFYNVYSLQLLQAVFQQMMPLQNGFMMHGAAIEYKGEGIIFTGFSGSGKSTQARLWRKYRNTITTNGDSPIIRKIQDTVYMYGTPWCGTSGESINRRTPLKAVVLVNKSMTNHVEEITGDDAVFAVYTNVLYYSQDEEDLDRLLEVLPDIVSKIKVYRLFCNMEEDAVNTLEKALYEENK